MNPTNLLSFGLPALIAWSLLDDFEKARVKRGLSPQVPLEEPEAIELLDTTTPATVALPEPPKPKSFEERKARLIEVLEEHRLTPIWELRNATPIRFTGWQRSGKSTKAQVLALLRQIDDRSHPVTVCSPHHVTPGDKAWSSSFTTTGAGSQWEEIKAVIDQLMTRLGKGDVTPHTTILDEFSGYAGKVGTDGYIQELMLSAVREMAKHHEMLILIAHGDTMAMNGNIKGLSAAMWGNFVTVGCNRILRDGKPYPSPKVTIGGGGFPECSLNWPDWFTPEWLLENFPELQTIAPQREEPVTPNLGFIPSVNQPEPEPEANGMEPHLKAIVDYIARKGEVSPRQIQQAKLKGLINCNITKADQIQLCLDALVYQGVLTLTAIDTYALWNVGQGSEQRSNKASNAPTPPPNTSPNTQHPELN
jgi:hypothetical protein